MTGPMGLYACGASSTRRSSRSVTQCQPWSAAGADLRRARLGALQVGDLLQHFKGATISVDQAVTLIAALGVNVV